MYRAATNRTRTAMTCLAVFASLIVAHAEAQTRGSSYKAPRTEFGQPDLQGIWTNATLTPFERDAKYGERRALSAEEATALERENAEFREEQDKPTDPSHGIQDLPKDCGGGFSGVNCGYNNFWVDPGSQMISINGEKRSSILLEPANGRLPARTPQGQARLAAMYAAFRSGSGADGPEIRPLGERCLLSFDSSAGPPMLPLLYNNNYQIVQTPDLVMIHVEMVHDVRMIRLNGKPRPANMKLWMGDSIGRWEGDTLVIETTNFRPDQTFRGTSPQAKITERLTRVAPDKIHYSFRVEDPAHFTAPFAGELAFNATREMIYEYACHEGNYALPGILAGAREEERQKAEAAGKK